jgi:hypothetical protein
MNSGLIKCHVTHSYVLIALIQNNWIYDILIAICIEPNRRTRLTKIGNIFELSYETLKFNYEYPTVSFGKYR